MRVAIIQSSYIPWKGFFDLVGRTDLYVVLDGAQYVKRHWHNRNRIMTPGGPIWLTIPGDTKSRFVTSNRNSHSRPFAANPLKRCFAGQLFISRQTIREAVLLCQCQVAWFSPSVVCRSPDTAKS